MKLKIFSIDLLYQIQCEVCFDVGIENVDDIVIFYREWQNNEILGIFLNGPGVALNSLIVWIEAVKFRYNYFSCKSYTLCHTIHIKRKNILLPCHNFDKIMISKFENLTVAGWWDVIISICKYFSFAGHRPSPQTVHRSVSEWCQSSLCPGPANTLSWLPPRHSSSSWWGWGPAAWPACPT